MPSVPSLEAPSVEAEPLPGRPYPRLADEASPAAYGAAAGSGLEQLSSDVVSEEAQYKTQHDNLRVIDANTQLEAGKDALLFGTPGPDGKQQGGAFSFHGADAINLPAKLLPAYQDMAQKISATLTPDQQQIFQRHIATTQNELNLQLNRHEAQEAETLQNEIHTNALDQSVSSASLGWRDPIVLGKARADIKSSIALDTRLSDPQKEIQTRAQLARMDGAVIDSMLAANNSAGAMQYFTSQRDEITAYDPRAALEMEKNIRAGQVQDVTNSVLRAYRSNLDAGATALQNIGKSGLTPEQQSQVIAGVDRGRADYAQQVRQDPSVRDQLTALDARLSEGKSLPTDVGTVDALWRKGAYTDDQRLIARDSVLRAQQKGADDHEDMSYVRDAYANRQPLDPKTDQKKVNLFTAEMTLGQAPGTPGYNNIATEVTARLGVVPSAAVDYARSSLVGGNPSQAAAGAQLLASLERANPRAYVEATDERTRAMASQVNDAVRAGADPQAAVTMARKADDDPSVTQLLNERWKKQTESKAFARDQPSALKSRITTDDYNIPADSALSQEGGSILGAVTGYYAGALVRKPVMGAIAGYYGGNRSSGPTIPTIPLAMQADFDTLTKDYFIHTGGNIEQARDAAARDLKSVWGISQVNGKPELMKYAPERMVPGLTTDAIRFDMAKEGYGAARLVESPFTGPSSGKEWNLAEPDKWGAFDIVRDDKGVPLRYQLPRPNPDANSYEKELQDFDDRQRLRAQRERENYAAEHPMPHLQ